MSDLPKTPTEARATGEKHYFTGAACKYGHVALRFLFGGCVECQRIKNASRDKAKEAKAASGRRKQNPNKHRATLKSYRNRNKEQRKLDLEIWRKDNPDRRKEQAQRYYGKNKDDIRGRRQLSRHYDAFMARLETEEAEASP